MSASWIEALTEEPGQLRPPQRDADEFMDLLSRMAGNPSVAPDEEVKFENAELQGEQEIGDLGPYSRGG